MRTSNGKKRNVTVLIYTHRSGVDVTVHKTPQGAEEKVYWYMNLWISEVPPSWRMNILQAMHGKDLRRACQLWAGAFATIGLEHGEVFRLIENVEVHP